MRFVPVKSADRQAALLDHNARDFLVWQRTKIVNAVRAHLGEFGIIVAKGIHNLARLFDAAREVNSTARLAPDMLAGQLRDTPARIEEVSARIGAMQDEDALARRLATVPGVGTIWSGAFAATTPDVAACRSARDYAAWLGLTPQANCIGGKERLGRISNAGNRYLRRLLYRGAMAQISARRGRREVPSGPAPDWLDRMLAREPVKVVAIALANRMARTIWALIGRGDSFQTAVA